MTDEIVRVEDETPYAIFLGGDDRYWDGIPARNLTKAEWDAISNENAKSHLLQDGLYKLNKKAGK